LRVSSQQSRIIKNYTYFVPFVSILVEKRETALCKAPSSLTNILRIPTMRGTNCAKANKRIIIVTAVLILLVAAVILPMALRGYKAIKIKTTKAESRCIESQLSASATVKSGGARSCFVPPSRLSKRFRSRWGMR
jgi:hypothetical protein